MPRNDCLVPGHSRAEAGTAARRSQVTPGQVTATFPSRAAAHKELGFDTQLSITSLAWRVPVDVRRESGLSRCHLCDPGSSAGHELFGDSASSTSQG